MNTPGKQPHRYNALARLLHWVMAALIIAMMFIGAGISSSLQWRPVLLDYHLAIGSCLFALVLIRLGNRIFSKGPVAVSGIPKLQAVAVAVAHTTLYALIAILPIVGWGMLSAGGYPRPVFFGWMLPALVEPEPQLYSLLHIAHVVLAYAFFALIMIHLAAALGHAWIKKDGVFSRMGLGSDAK